MFFMSSSCDGLRLPAQYFDNESALVSLLTPENSEVVTNIQDLLIIDCTLPFTELIHFYKNIFHDLGVEETGINNMNDGIWIYGGLYEGGKPISVELRDEDKNVRIYIIY